MAKGIDHDECDAQGSEMLAALERFVIDNDDLLALESRIGTFNIFDALGITHAEIRHSNFLAFILDPAESHGQGQLFLTAILMDLLKMAPPELRPFSPIDLDGADLRGIEIKREWEHIDLLITCKQPPFAVVVENKVYSQEHSDQLRRYESTVGYHVRDLPTLLVYLTPDGDEPSEERWLPYTYADIHRVLKRNRDTHENAIGDEVLVFLDHYLNLLGTRFMNDEVLDELCQTIYKNHRQALDLIWERVGSPESTTLREVVELIEGDGRWHLLYQSSKYVDFMPKSWSEWLSPSNGDDGYPFCISLRSKTGKLVFTPFVGPMMDAAKRSDIVTALRKQCPALGFKPSKAYQVEGKWNRIAATENILEWGDNDEPDRADIREKVKAALDELYPRLEKLALLFKPLWKG